MSDAVHVTTHVDDAKANLAGFLKNKANLAALISALVTEVQTLEDALWQLLTQRDLDSAAGQQLDGIGDILNLLRAGLSDDAYRTQLRAKILLDVISGLPNEVLGLVALLVPGATTRLWQAFPASFSIVVGTAPSDPSAVGDLLRSGTAAGVSSQIVYPASDLAHAFTASDSNLGLVASTSLGFADSSTPGTGGELTGSA